MDFGAYGTSENFTKVFLSNSPPTRKNKIIRLCLFFFLFVGLVFWSFLLVFFCGTTTSLGKIFLRQKITKKECVFFWLQIEKVIKIDWYSRNDVLFFNNIRSNRNLWSVEVWITRNKMMFLCCFFWLLNSPIITLKTVFVSIWKNWKIEF